MRRRLRFTLSFLLLALCSLTRAALAQFDNRAWTTYLHAGSCGDLLCQNDTVWMATGEAGLLRYERSTGTWSAITREPNGLAGNDIQCLVFDAHGRLFAGVPGKGVSWLGTDGHWSLINEFDGLPSDTALVMRAQGDTVWIGTTRGLALWNGKTLAGSIPDVGTKSPFGNDRINGIGFTGDTMFVATPVGVYWARKSERLSRWVLINLGLPLNPDVTSLATNGRNVFVVAAGQGIKTSFQWLPQAADTGSWGSDFPATNSAVRRVRDDYGHIFCTTAGPVGVGGIYRRRENGPGWDLSPDSAPTDNADLAAVEPGMAPDGKLFSSTRGLLLEEGSSNWVRHDPPGPVGNNTSNIFWADGSIYANYPNEGVSRLRGGVWRNWPANDLCTSGCDTTFLTSSFPFGALVDTNGTKWIGIWSGPMVHFDDTVDPPVFQNIVNRNSDPVEAHLHTCVWSSASDHNQVQRGRWFGLDTDALGDSKFNPIGIDLYDSAGTLRQSFQPGYPNLRNGQVRALAVDRDNVMWVGYAKNSNAGVSTFPVPPVLGDSISLTDVKDTNIINCYGIQIYRDSVWVLGDDGLRRFDRIDKKEVAQFDIAGPPAPVGACHPLAVAPDGSVFVGTGAGVRWHRRGLAPVDFTPANTPLADIEVRSVFVEPSGILWVGTASGVNRFDPHFVPPPIPKLPSLAVTLYPNPAWRTRAGFELKLRGQATRYEGELYDVRGRLIHRFVVDGNDRVVWNGFDMAGRGVEAGVYFLIVRGGGAEAKSRIVVLR